MKPIQSGFTLTEVMISTVIIGALMAAVMSSMTSVMDYSKLGEAQDDLAISGSRVMKQISEDIAVSGWFVPQGKQYQSDPTADRSARYYPYVQIQPYDSGLGLGTGGLGLGFPHHKRAKNMVWLPHMTAPVSEIDNINRYNVLPGNYLDAVRDFDGMNVVSMENCVKSFFARSQELIFLRCTMSTVAGQDAGLMFPQRNADGWRTLPSKTTVSSQTPHNALGILRMDEYQRAEVEAGSSLDPTKYGSAGGVVYRKKAKGGTGDYWIIYDPELPTAWLNWNGGDYSVNLRWETIEPIDSSATTNPPANANLYPGFTPSTLVTYTNVSLADPNIPLISILREYSYVVVPSATGVGRLVRCEKKKFSAQPVIVTAPGPGVGNVISSAVEPDDNSAGAIYGMVVDKVISDDVARITFETIRTSRIPDASDSANYGAGVAAMIQQNALDVNQIRIRIYMVKDHRVNGENQPVYQRFETIASMRARSSATDVENDRKAHSNFPPSALNH